MNDVKKLTNELEESGITVKEVVEKPIECELVETENLIAYTGEIVLIGSDWSDFRGYTTKIGMHEADDGGHPLKRFHKGTRFHCVLVEIADDEEPIDQIRKRALELELKKAGKGGRWSIDSGILCHQVDFHRYLKSVGKVMRHWDKDTRTKMARQFILDTLRIKSRKEIDFDKEKQVEYQNLILSPYRKWHRENPRSENA